MRVQDVRHGYRQGDCNKLRIASAASKCYNGMVLLGRCHGDIVQNYARNMGVRIPIKTDDTGFMTTRGEFIDRKTACIIAREAGQITHTKELLYSEDLIIRK